jgi:hypothetical protein
MQPKRILVSALAFSAALAGAAGVTHLLRGPAPEAAPVAAVDTGATSADDDEDGEPARGMLVLREDVLHRCKGIEAQAAAAEDDEDAAIGTMRALAACMRKGGLRDRKIVVRGPDEACSLVKSTLERVGVARGRLEFVRLPDPPSDVAGREAPKVEIGLTKEPLRADERSLAVAVDRRRVVAFLVMDTFD